LHPVGILFPHINEDARSKSHQMSCILQTRKTKPEVSAEVHEPYRDLQVNKMSYSVTRVG